MKNLAWVIASLTVLAVGLPCLAQIGESGPPEPDTVGRPRFPSETVPRIVWPDPIAKDIPILVPADSPRDIRVVRVFADSPSPYCDILLPVAQAIVRHAGLTIPAADTDLAHAELRLVMPRSRIVAEDEKPPEGQGPVAFPAVPRPPNVIRPDRLYVRLLWITPKPSEDAPAGVVEGVHDAVGYQGTILCRMDPESEDPDPALKAVPDGRFALEVARLLAPSAGKDPVEILMAAMTELRALPRAFVAAGLGASGDRRGLPALVKALDDDEAMVRESAVRALGRLGPPAKEPLLAALKNTDAAIRAGAAEGLAAMLRSVSDTAAEGAPRPPTDARVMAALLGAAGDSSAEVRAATAHALGAADPGKAAPPLIAALKEKEPVVREAAAAGLCELRSPETAAPLAAALDDESPWVRHEAGAALLGLKAAAIPALAAALKAKTPAARGLAAFLLGRLKAAAAVDSLVPALHDEGWMVRAAAAQALGQAGDGRVVEPLAGALQDTDPSVRRAAAWALGRLALPDGIRPLRAAKEDWDVEVAKEAEEALKACQEPLPDVLQKAAADGRTQTLITLLPRLPKEGNAKALIDAVTALRDSTSPEAVPVLLTILKEADFPLYEAAASALGHLKDRRAVEPLVANLDRDSRAVPAAAALGEIGDPQALPYLEEALRRSKDEGVRGAIKAALSKLRAAGP